MSKQKVRKKKATTKKISKKTAVSKAAGKKASAKKTSARTKVTKKAIAKKKTVNKRAAAASKKAATKKKVSKKTAAKKKSSSAKSANKKRPVTAKKTTKKKTRKTTGGNGSSAPMDGDWLPEGYEPKVKLKRGYKPGPKEEYMSATQLEYFRRKLYRWRQELVDESQQTIDHLRTEVRDVGDEAERATRETENSLELRTRDRYRKLIRKVDQALKRIDEGDYGFCEETDEEIGLARLEARPIATLSLDAQERWELKQRQLSK